MNSLAIESKTQRLLDAYQLGRVKLSLAIERRLGMLTVQSLVDLMVTQTLADVVGNLYCQNIGSATNKTLLFVLTEKDACPNQFWTVLVAADSDDKINPVSVYQSISDKRLAASNLLLMCDRIADSLTASNGKKVRG